MQPRFPAFPRRGGSFRSDPRRKNGIIPENGLDVYKLARLRFLSFYQSYCATKNTVERKCINGVFSENIVGSLL